MNCSLYRYAHYLFDNGSFEDAMEHFVASQVEINYVLSLYPSIILPKSSFIPEPEKLVDINGDAPNLSRGSSGMSDDMESSLPHALDTDESADLESRKMSHNTLMALIKFLQKKRYSIVEKAAAEGTEEAVSNAVGNNFISYGNNRPKKPSKVRMFAFSFYILLLQMVEFQSLQTKVKLVIYEDILILMSIIFHYDNAALTEVGNLGVNLNRMIDMLNLKFTTSAVKETACNVTNMFSYSHSTSNSTILSKLLV